MSQTNKPGEPPDLMEVFKTLANTLKQQRGDQGRQPQQRTQKPAARDQRATSRPSSRTVSDRDADFPPSRDAEIYERVLEKTNTANLDVPIPPPPERSPREAVRASETPRAQRQAQPFTGDAPILSRPQALRTQLRDPASLRAAIVINELLQKPVALRRRQR
ncbi:MAG: hypothetical protein ACR2RL_07865 [Gammaproteobacteria bacterium]